MTTGDITGVSRRTLIYVPILHTQADMGGLGESVHLAMVRKLGRLGARRALQRIEKVWLDIEKALELLGVRYEGMRVYQDGLPICGRESEIVAEVAEGGSRNYRLVMRLQQRGAIIMGTESPALLQEEYDLAQQLLAAKGALASARAESRRKLLSESLLRRRDQFIAERINSTLHPGETGMLFLGELHSVEHLLDTDIDVAHLI